MTLILLDAKNCLFRFGFVHKNLRTADGIYTGAAYGVLGLVLRLKKKYPDAKFVLVWDGDGPSWRHKLWAGYKSNRKKEKSQDVLNILSQIPVLTEVANAVEIVQITVPHVEADDVLAVLAVKALKRGHQPVIYSSDKDFMQLMHRGVVVIRDVDKTVKLAPETKQSIMRKFGCLPGELLSVRAIAGDKSDAIPNPVEKIGPKTAVKVVRAGVDPASKSITTEQGLASGKAGAKLLAVWPEVERNYRLMRLVTSTKSSVLDEKARAFLRVQVARVFKELAGLSAGNRAVAYRDMLKVLAGLELEEALQNRGLLRRLQS